VVRLALCVGVCARHRGKEKGCLSGQSMVQRRGPAARMEGGGRVADVLGVGQGGVR